MNNSWVGLLQKYSSFYYYSSRKKNNDILITYISNKTSSRIFCISMLTHVPIIPCLIVWETQIWLIIILLITYRSRATLPPMLSFRSSNTIKFSFPVVDVFAIKSIIYNINWVAFGIDNIHIAMLRLCSKSVVPYVVHIINCWEFSSSWTVQTCTGKASS